MPRSLTPSNALNEDIGPPQKSTLETNHHHAFVCNYESSANIKDNEFIIDGARATTCDFEMKGITANTDELETECHLMTNMLGPQFGNPNSIGLEIETDNVVTEYTTVVVGKVLSTEENQITKENLCVKDEQETIYASIEHLNESQKEESNYILSRSSSDQSSPSNDIQLDFEKDFCSVEDALFNGAQVDADIASNPNDKTTRIVVEDESQTPEDVDTSLNAIPEVSSCLYALDSELTLRKINLNEETDCDLDIHIDDAHTILEPPNRAITIIRPEIVSQSGSSNATEQMVLSSADRRTNETNMITLEIDTTTSVI